MNRAELLSSPNLERIASESLAWGLGLSVQGIEVTQAIQYFDAADHLTDAADRGANNAVRLVSGKPAWVRVHLSSLFGASGVTGTLEVQRRSGGFFWNTVATLNPDPSSATSVASSLLTSYAATRGSLSGSLNFIIPAAEMIGTLRLIARVSAGSRKAEASVDVGVTLRQRLRLAGVMISYNGPASNAPGAPNLTLAAPTTVDLQAMSGTTLTLFPVESTAAFRAAGTLLQTNHLQDTTFPTSGCGAEWDALHGRVANARTADGNQPGWIYYGLLPAGVPMGPVGGCGGGGVAVGPINQAGTLAHEAGHACGLEHAPAGGAPNPDPSYPAYEPYDPTNTPMASIGEYGLNVNNGNIASPQTFRDFMSYAGPAWISPYHYGRLLSNALLNPATVGVDYPWWKDLVWEELRKYPRIPEPDPPFDLELPMFPPSYRQDVISLIVRVERGKVAEVLHVARTRAHTGLSGAVQTPFRARLLGADARVAAEGALFRLQTAGSGCGGGCSCHDPNTYLAQAFLADLGPGSRMEIADGEDVVWSRDAPAEPPRIGRTAVKADRRGNVTVSWTCPGAVAEFWLRWSADGETWQSVMTGLAERTVRLTPGQLPPGKGLLQVVAHDGFFSTYGEPVAVTTPGQAPEAVILHPVDGYTYVAGQSVRLWASVVGAADDVTREATWLVDGQAVAHGLDAWVSLEPGKRRVSLRLGDRGTAASVTVTVTRPEPASA